MKRILFLDLDDVLTDWKGYITRQAGGFVPLCHDTTQLSEAEQHIHNNMLQVGLKQAFFWEELPMHEGAVDFLKQMYDLFDEVHILSFYYPYRAESKPLSAVCQQKKNWIKRHLDPNFNSERIWVVSEKKEAWFERHKTQFSGTCFLIDNDIQNVQMWQEACGVGIFHETFEKTLQVVQSVIR